MVGLRPSMLSVSFIGEGALLSRAIKFSLEKKIKIDKIFLPENNSFKKKPLPYNKNIIFFNRENLSDLLINAMELNSCLFSINNKYIIEDIALKRIKNVYNIHNGLVQRYRGLGEVCVFSAYLKQDIEYGATLHIIEPNQGPDCGQIYAQKSFSLERPYKFQDIMTRSIIYCQKIFEENILNILQGKRPIKKSEDKELGKIYTYKNIREIIKNTKVTNMDLGVYEKDLMRIKKAIEKV